MSVLVGLSTAYSENLDAVPVRFVGGSVTDVDQVRTSLEGVNARELVMLDRDESGPHAVQLSIHGKGLLDTPDMVLCDIRDEQALMRYSPSTDPTWCSKRPLSNISRCWSSIRTRAGRPTSSAR